MTSAMCEACHGTGQVANDGYNTPWPLWDGEVKSGRWAAGLLVQDGTIKPIECAVCGGEGRVALAPATHYQHTATNGRTYFLNVTEVRIKRGRQLNYYFSRTPIEGAGVPQLPAGREVVEAKNGVPFLRRLPREGGGY